MRNIENSKSNKEKIAINNENINNTHRIFTNKSNDQ